MGTQNEGHRSVARALHALEITVASETGVTLGELAEHVGAAKSSLHPLLRALVFRGYLVHEDNRYRPGPAIDTLAMAQHPAVVPVARPFMEDLLQQFNETVMLGSVVGETLVYLHSLESTHVVRYSPPQVRPATDHPSSIRKLYLAQLDDADLEKYVAANICEDKRERLLAEVREARTTGVAYNHGDTFPDLSAVAARITGDQGVLACLALGGPSRRIDARSDEITEALREATAGIETVLSAGSRNASP
ncbi:helix-turn-helix domain-containing protein [Saccharopolyspora sp. ID03-671]|uniref:IclR family transcriptional regulator n=1 Tax=Saccharopolyspora sp. ID03-671 TaxID=3073066 RepID=UPI0032502A77